MSSFETRRAVFVLATFSRSPFDFVHSMLSFFFFSVVVSDDLSDIASGREKC